MVYARRVYSKATRACEKNCCRGRLRLARCHAPFVKAGRMAARGVCLEASEGRGWLLYRQIDTRYRRIPTERPQKARSH
eukprot:1840315-Pleurochrysis_carterae.AAC.1